MLPVQGERYVHCPITGDRRAFHDWPCALLWLRRQIRALADEKTPRKVK